MTLPASTYVMETPRSCGRDSLVAITGKTRAEVSAAMGDQDHGDMRDDIEDWPPNLKQALERMGIPYWEPTLADILDGACVNGHTMILVHGTEHPYLEQHYIVLHSVTPTHVLAWWGNGPGDVQSRTRAEFERLFRAGAPKWACEAGRPGGRLRFWERWAVHISRWTERVLGWVWGR